MPYDISTTERLGPGQFLTINDRTGINILAPATGQTVVSFNNAGTILVNSDSPYLVAGFNYDYNSFIAVFILQSMHCHNQRINLPLLALNNCF